jgi:predicted metal-binding protein
MNRRRMNRRSMKVENYNGTVHVVRFTRCGKVPGVYFHTRCGRTVKEGSGALPVCQGREVTCKTCRTGEKEQ